MSDEEAFLNQILSELSNDTARLVYADWLEERGDDTSVQKAEFLRLECALVKVPPKKREQNPLRLRLQELAEQLETDWLAVVSKLAIENCEEAFAFRCPKQWEKLQPTDDRDVRYCDTCLQTVHYCATIDVARDHAEAGHCVAVDLGVLRSKDDLKVPEMVMGMLVADFDLEEERRRDRLSNNQ